MKRTYLQRNKIEDQSKLNTGEQSRNSPGIGEFHPAEIVLKEQHFDPKGKQHFNRFVRMGIKFKEETLRHESPMRTLNYSKI